MTKTNTNRTVELVARLRNRLEPFFPEPLNNSQVFIDLADIYEISQLYIKLIDEMVSSESYSEMEANQFAYSLDTHVVEHLNYHLASLKNLMPDVIDAVESSGNQKVS